MSRSAKYVIAAFGIRLTFDFCAKPRACEDEFHILSASAAFLQREGVASLQYSRCRQLLFPVPADVMQGSFFSLRLRTERLTSFT